MHSVTSQYHSVASVALRRMQKNALTLWYKDFFVYLCRPKQALMGLRDVPSNYYHEGQRSMMESVVMRFYCWLKVWLIGGYEVYGRN